MQFLRANTAVDVLIGPFVEDGDGDTPVTGLTLDVELSKNGQALANKTDATAPTHDAAGTVDGYYNCELDATDTNTEGCLVLVVHHADALPIRHEYMVMAEAAWDSMFVAKDDGFMDVNVKTIGRTDTDETAADNMEDMFDGTGYAGGTIKFQSDLTQILAHTLTDTGTQLADGFQTFFDVAGPTTMLAINLPNQTMNITGSITGNLAGDVTGNVDGTVTGKTPAEAGDVETGCTSSLVAHNLDHLCLTATAAADMTTEVADNTIISRILSNGDTSAFAPSTDGLQPSFDYIATGYLAIMEDTGTTIPGTITTLQTAVDNVPTTAEFEARTIASADYVVTSDTIAGVTLVTTCTTNTDMRGTDSGALASVCTEARLAELDAANLPAVTDAILVDTGTTLPTALLIIDNFLDTEIAAILVDTGTTLPATLSTIEGKIDTIDTNVDSVLTDTGTTLPASIAGLNDITVADIIAGVADGSYDLQEMMRCIFSACCLKTDGGGSATIHTRDSADGKNRVTATVDSDGNRTAITLDAS